MMNEDIPFNREPPAPGIVERLSPGVRRLVAPNGGPFTFTGTCTYIVGHGRVAVVDPGPADDGHLAALLRAMDGERVEAIAVTHTHRDHSSAVPALVAATGARTYGGGPHRAARPLQLGEVNLLDAAADTSFAPEVTLVEGDAIEGPGWRLAAVATPGHCANHLAFAFAQDDVLLSGDHVMAWSTSIVAPPDGAMGDYMASLRKLSDRTETRYFPGHGGPVAEPRRYVEAMIRHRVQRENSIIEALKAGPATIAALTAQVYVGLQPALFGAAALNLFAHLEDLVQQGRVGTQGVPAFDGTYWLA